MKPQDTREMMTGLLAMFVALRAHVEAVEDMSRAALARAGVEELDGVPLAEWVARARSRAQERILLEHGDRDPAMADLLQRFLDGSRGKK